MLGMGGMCVRPGATPNTTKFGKSPRGDRSEGTLALMLLVGGLEADGSRVVLQAILFLFRCWILILSVWVLIMIIKPARAGFLGPGRITLGAHFGGVDGDP